MNSSSPVKSGVLKLNLIKPVFIGGYVISVVVLCIILFPNHLITEQVLTLTQPEPITVTYLTQLIQANPTQLAYKIALAQQEMGLHHWQQAEALINDLALDETQQDQVSRLQFMNAFTKAYALPKGVEREKALAALKPAILALLNLDLSANQCHELGDLALKLNAPATALAFYEKVVNLEGEQSPSFYRDIGDTAMQTSQYKLAANYYWQASVRESQIELQRKDIILALKAYQSGNLMQDGANLLTHLSNEVIDNEAMLVFLTKYAIAANRPDLAEVYIKRVLLQQTGSS